MCGLHYVALEAERASNRLCIEMKDINAGPLTSTVYNLNVHLHTCTINVHNLFVKLTIIFCTFSY